MPERVYRFMLQYTWAAVPSGVEPEQHRAAGP